MKELICVMHCSNCKKISHFDYYDFIHGRLEEFEQCPHCGSYDMPEIDEREKPYSSSDDWHEFL